MGFALSTTWQLVVMGHIQYAPNLRVEIASIADMFCLVEKYKCGFVSEKFTLEAMINTLNQLTPNMINLMKDGNHKAADYLWGERMRESGFIKSLDYKLKFLMLNILHPNIY